jgi:FkbM family methyltransferase
MNVNTVLKACRDGFLMFNRLDAYIGRSLELYGEVFPAEAALFRKLVRPGMTVLDVGANIGAHTLLFARLAGPAGRVLAFEPQRKLFQMLCGNCAVNGLENVFAYHGFAAAEQGEQAVKDIDMSRVGNFGGQEMAQMIAEETSETVAHVKSVRIDDMSLAACDFVKIDVEGMELSVLQGAAETIRRHRPILFVENDRPDSHRALCAFIRDTLNYRMYWHLGRLFSTENFYNNTVNVFGATVSCNMLCLPAESAIVSYLPGVDADRDWHEQLTELSAEM